LYINDIRSGDKTIKQWKLPNSIVRKSSNFNGGFSGKNTFPSIIFNAGFVIWGFSLRILMIGSIEVDHLQNTFANIKKLKLLNCISMTYDQATKLFSNGNGQIVLSRNQKIYMVDLAGKKYISKYIFFPAGFATTLRIMMFG
jgi:hypothetical protein